LHVPNGRPVVRLWVVSDASRFKAVPAQINTPVLDLNKTPAPCEALWWRRRGASLSGGTARPSVHTHTHAHVLRSRRSFLQRRRRRRRRNIKCVGESLAHPDRRHSDSCRPHVNYNIHHCIRASQ